jgi:hypothetical protein
VCEALCEFSFSFVFVSWVRYGDISSLYDIYGYMGLANAFIRPWPSISRRRGAICAALLLTSRVKVYMLDLLVGFGVFIL